VRFADTEELLDDSDGQAFADGIFRLFRSRHPTIELYSIHPNTNVQDMINRVLSSNISLAEAPLRPM
jgi:hypothetical protein